MMSILALSESFLNHSYLGWLGRIASYTNLVFWTSPRWIRILSKDTQETDWAHTDTYIGTVEELLLMRCVVTCVFLLKTSAHTWMHTFKIMICTHTVHTHTCTCMHGKNILGVYLKLTYCTEEYQNITTHQSHGWLKTILDQIIKNHIF